MTRSPAASEWVRAMPRGARIDWAELEARVLREHPEVLRSLGVAGRIVRSQGRGWQVGFGVAVLLAAIVGLAIIWAPIWGLATLAGDAFGRVDVDGAFAIPVAGIGALHAIIARRARPRSHAGPARVSGPDPEAAAAAVRALAPEERDAMEADRRAAVEWLRLHGSIGPEEASAALRVELGRLGEALGR